MFQGFKKADPYVGARKLRLTRPPVRRDSRKIGYEVDISPKCDTKKTSYFLDLIKYV